MKTKILSLGDQLRESGKEEGIQIGVKKGREEGIKKGRREEREKRNFTATKNMLEKDFPVSIICDILDVTPEFVQKVKKTLRENG